MNDEIRKQLKQEFGIHFKNSPDELKFLEAFIDEHFVSKQEILEEIEEMFPEKECCQIEFQKVLNILTKK